LDIHLLEFIATIFTMQSCQEALPVESNPPHTKWMCKSPPETCALPWAAPFGKEKVSTRQSAKSAEVFFHFNL